MGMFDYIKYSIPCPVCGARVDGFQSKDGDCLLQEMTPLELTKQANPGLGYEVSMHSICEDCDLWIETKFRGLRRHKYEL